MFLDPGNLSLICKVNGVAMQAGNTNQLVFSVNECIAWVSQFCTLKPGDLILTGTPPGVGCFKNPPVYLKVSLQINFERQADSKYHKAMKQTSRNRSSRELDTNAVTHKLGINQNVETGSGER